MVQTFRNSIAVWIGGAAALIHHGSTRRIRTEIQAVADTISISIDRGAERNT